MTLKVKFKNNIMQKLVELVRVSSKETFIKLRSVWEINCNSLNKNFKVTNLFLRHISWSSKWRVIKDVIERLSSISLIEKIANNWKLIETRKNINIEKLNYSFSYKINLTIRKLDFFIILAEKSNWNIILISVFMNYLE
jgi:hypothetical protein